jgi:ATP-dependent Clp protease ATP-binding subunit ClpC
MYENYSEEAKKIINRCHNLAVGNNEYIIGSEYLLLALFQERNSSCNILLRELNVTEELIKETIQDIILFRKSISGLVIYTQCLKKILEKAITLKDLTNSNLVYEEHLFYTLLETKNSIAYVVLDKLNIDIEALQDEIIEVMDWDIDYVDKEPETIHPLSQFSFVTNLTEEIKNKPLPPLVMRKDILNRINNVIHKKFKRNVLLIGNAGVGKTAIVEGLATSFVESNKNKQILSLNVNSLVSGTKYRGDFEKRIESFINEVKNKEEYILFIDEIHNVINQSNLDAGVDLANIIKPALSRDDICCIGATTINEYYKYLAKDSAFTRRFVKIFVDEPSLEDTITILKNIKGYYEDYHKISAPDEIIEYICRVSDKLITNNHFPDKAIDLLDESLALSKNLDKEVLEKEQINQLVNQINNNKLTPTIKTKLEQYPFLIKNFLRYYTANKFDYKPIASLLCLNASDENLDHLINDIQQIFNIKSEATKIIDLNNYGEHHSISNIIGAPPGYVGYDNDNTLTKFVNKYQKSIIIFKNLDDILINMRNIINQILETGFIEDMSSNKIYFSNSIIIGTSKQQHKVIGYIDDQPETEVISKVKLPFEHTLSEFTQKKQTTITVDYSTVFHNYLSYLKQLDQDIDLSDLYSLKDISLNEESLQSFENIMGKIWVQGVDKKEIKLSFDKDTNQFIIIQSNE